ncbi:GNAT family N-acetyltransferase [Mucilaginibacter myungsuensis]|uniref:GNAT family N-acetyltransferase n=1 Tax=Mucilaginibacter myungsuensis TaxID=649104 RepID=A0A929KUB1_9SPHI|nr:GNAT family N-acetyltransferase [Mucilaginibacter myungsuensis]MBE9660538.1 GNAT family N-acetyltransferase [Mucilaginibacter myungsuensis]MDN3600583.1 GNAT family N-acetyltransferase [Mucilaginibacter myungsuensis]
MTIVEVKDKHTRKQFLDVARFIYKDDPNWVCPLDNEVEAVFDPAKNNFHKHGKITRWVLLNDQQKPVGRVAAFINEEKAYKHDQPTGGMGFFECIDNKEYAFTLFDTAQNWLQQHGMKAMDGPINFGENDSFWGLLVEGFTQPSYGMTYNLSYYRAFFEEYGFTTLYEQITNHLSVHKPFPERFTKIANWVAQKPGYSFEHLKIGQIDKFASDFMAIYNDAWKDFENFVPIERATVLESFEKMKAIMDEKLIWFAYVDKEPASFIIILPDANQMIRSLNGKLDLIGKLKFLYNRWKGVTRMRAVVMGTKQKFQKHGLESAIFIKLKEYVLPLNQYDELELSWVGDFNDKMLAIHEATGATFGKRHLTMRKIF